jgi:hypothetical protein
MDYGIKKYLSFALEYGKELISTLFFYLSLPPAIYGFAQVWFLFELPEFPKLWLGLLASLFFILANFQVYVRGKKKLIELEHTEVSYEILYDIQHIDFSEDFIHLKEQKAGVKERKKDAYVMLGFLDKTWDDYEVELKEYEENLHQYVDNETKILRIFLKVINAGGLADEDIGITIIPSSNCSFVTNELDIERPEIPNEPAVRFLSNLNSLSIRQNSEFKVREIIEYSHNKIEVELFKLRASEEMRVLNDPIICKIEGKEASLEVKINTKNTRESIEKRILLSLNKDK